MFCLVTFTKNKFSIPKTVDYFSRSKWKYIEIAPWEECKDTSHLESFFQDVVDRGGEGVILRDPKSIYQPGRSAGYLKLKVFFISFFFIIFFCMRELLRFLNEISVK
jgi:hypothetical protein